MLAIAFHLAARPLLSQRNRAASIKAYHVKRVLADIDTHHRDCGVELLGHGVLPPLIADASFACWRGRRRGHTIPLTSQKGD
jgi:hypothetical protein